MKKKLFITILVLTLTTAVFAQKAEPERSFRYQLTDDGKGIQITAYTGTNPNLVIPRTIEGYPVKIIGPDDPGGFVNISGTNTRNPYRLLQTVIVPEGVEVISACAFQNCINLRKVILPSTVYLIGNMAFDDCINLEEINIPSGIEIIGGWAFQNCRELYNLIIPNSITSIYWKAKSTDGINYLAGQFDKCGKLRIATRQRLKELGYTEGF